MKRNINLDNVSLEEKRTILKNILIKKLKKGEVPGIYKSNDIEDYNEWTHDMFVHGFDYEHDEIKQFDKWVNSAIKDGIYIFETERLSEQKPEVEFMRKTGERLKALNFSSYNYLGYGFDRRVKNAAKEAIDKYGTGAMSSPIVSGNFIIHKKLEEKLIEFLGFNNEEYGVSLFSTGYGVNTGTISAYMKPGGYIILDEFSHMSLIEGAQLSGAGFKTFKHNNMQDLERLLFSIKNRSIRKLICCEGVYSSDGSKADIKTITGLAKKYNARTLIDEAHSIMISGKHGRGVAEDQGVLDKIDMFIITFSKAFCSLGGALVAKKEITRYVNWYAKCRMFSAAMPPSVAGGIIKAIELGSGPDGAQRRKKIIDNSGYMRLLLKDSVNILNSETWIIPILYYNENLTLKVGDYLQRNGIDAGLMCFPAVPKGSARIRLFITSEHTKAQIKKAAGVIIAAAKKYNFIKYDIKTSRR